METVALKTRKAKAGEDFTAPSAHATDPKHIFGWPVCKYLSFAKKPNGDTILVSGGYTREEAVTNGYSRIARLRKEFDELMSS